MRIVLLHGAPAVGKLTVAQALGRRLGARVMDNHAAIGFAGRLFDWGTPGFWTLVDHVRRDALRVAAEFDVPLVVLTLCYCHPQDETVLRDIEVDTMDCPGGAELLPVFLHCPDALAEERVVAGERVAMGKLASVEGRREFVGRNDFRAIPRENCLAIDTSVTDPDTAAARIAHYFDLKPPSTIEKDLP